MFSTFPAMRRLATGLFFLMLALFLAARAYEQLHPAIGFVRAFAEAAMVGALADWFAVTALFRRPLGLPIPHTAIVPRSKDRIGEGLGRFIERNFLEPAALRRRLAGIDITGKAADWLLTSGRAERLAEGLAAWAPRLIAALDDKAAGQAVVRFAARRIGGMDLGAFLARIVEFLVAGNRHEPIIGHLIQAADRLLLRQEGAIRERVSANTGWFWRALSLDDKASDALISALRAEIAAAAHDPGHQLRTGASRALKELAEDLRASPKLRADLDAFKQSLTGHPAFLEELERLWTALLDGLRNSAQSAPGDWTPHLARGLKALAESLHADDGLRQRLNRRLTAWAAQLAAERGPDVAALVAQTVKGWDAQTIVDRIEQGVGRDLQYIRINGTLIGGLAGLAIHALEMGLG